MKYTEIEWSNWLKQERETLPSLATTEAMLIKMFSLRGYEVSLIQVKLKKIIFPPKVFLLFSCLGSASYACYGEEVAPTSAQEHLQAYIRFKHGKTKSSVVRLLVGYHVTVCVRDNVADGFTIASENRKYCSKTRDIDPVPNAVFVEFGTLPPERTGSEEGGKRTREQWEEIKQLAKDDKLDDVDAEIYIKHYSTLKKIAKEHQVLPGSNEAPCGVWYYGKSGTGKSHAARVDYPEAYLKLPNKWWDGYTGQEHVLIDDFDKNHHMLAYHLKIWADKYAFPVETKGIINIAKTYKGPL